VCKALSLPNWAEGQQPTLVPVKETVYFCQVFKERKWIGNISYKNGFFEFGQARAPDESGAESGYFPKTFPEVLEEAKRVAAGAAKAANKIPVPDQV
jgi:hypothetical protein